ncbi:MAG: symmetrical bis(5'-nucleosyl)-tetraphosphatase [Thermoanaerobaculales bacterium]
MATWVIGDIHGCWRTLERLLEQIEWRPAEDELWLVGDLVNRGPHSLEVLRWAHRHRARLTVVLGNHDLHLLSRAVGVAQARAEDTLDDVLTAPDRDELLRWLRGRPLVHQSGRFLMVHAGLLPEWDIELACGLAGSVESQLGGVHGEAVLAQLEARGRTAWRADLESGELAVTVVSVLTRLRVVGEDGGAVLGFTGPPGEAPEGSRPWFEESAVLRQGFTVVFGHWAQLGFFRSSGAVCLDSGCVYGGKLTAFRLDDGRAVHVPVVDVS